MSYERGTSVALSQSIRPHQDVETGLVLASKLTDSNPATWDVDMRTVSEPKKRHFTCLTRVARS